MPSSCPAQQPGANSARGRRRCCLGARGAIASGYRPASRGDRDRGLCHRGRRHDSAPSTVATTTVHRGAVAFGASRVSRSYADFARGLVSSRRRRSPGRLRASTGDLAARVDLEDLDLDFLSSSRSSRSFRHARCGFPKLDGRPFRPEFPNGRIDDVDDLARIDLADLVLLTMPRPLARGPRSAIGPTS